MANDPMKPSVQDAPLVQPRADAPATEDTIYKRRLLNQDVVAERAAEDAAQLTAKQSWTMQIAESSVASKLGRFVGSLDTKFDSEPWDKAGNYSALTEGVPREFWEDIFEEGTLASAQRRAAGVKRELHVKQTLGMQRGLASVAAMAGSLVDLDAPLGMASGGSLFGAKAAGRAALAGRSALVSATRGGAVAGLEAGVVLGGGELAFGLTSDWRDAASVALTTTLFGAAGGAMGGRMDPAVQEAVLGARKKLIEDVRVGSPDAWEDVPTMEAYVPGAHGLNSDPVTVDGDFDIPEFDPRQSLSAAAPRSGPAIYPALTDPLGRTSDSDRAWIQSSRKWAYAFDVKDKIAFVLNDDIGRLSTKPWMNIASNDTMSLFRSGATMAHHAIGAIFEMPGGQLRAGGPANAAQLQNMYHRRIMDHTADINTLRDDWARSNGTPLVTIGGRSYGTSRKTSADFNRRVMLDLNNAALGRPRDPDSRIRLAADAYNQASKESAAIAKGLDGEIPLDGADGMTKDWYMPYRANGWKIAHYLKEKLFTQADVVAAVKQSYLNAGSVRDPDLAEIVAKAWVSRFVGRAAKIDDSMISVFSNDGREFLRESLRINGMPEAQIDGIMTRFDGEAAERGKSTMLKHRNDLDFSTPIGNSGLSIVDLMKTDLEQVYTGYAREISGASALARHGITNKTKEAEYISALIAEQRMLGETPMDGNKLKAMFSTFHAGPEWGYGFGATNEGIGIVADIKSLASLSALQLNMFAQAAETTVGIVASGLNQWGARGWGRWVDTKLANANKANLRELGIFMGNIGQDHKTLKAHLSLDDSVEYMHGDPKVSRMLNRTREFLDRANYMSGMVSGLNHVRGFQQEVAVLGMMDRVVREIRARNMDLFKDTGRLHRDLGLTEDIAERIAAEINAGKVTFGKFSYRGIKTEYIDRLNLDQWPEDLAQDFAAALNRGMNQSVQYGVAGERDRWTHTVWGSAISHLQTFPLMAVQKQFFRNAMARDREAAIQALAGVSMAYASLYVRDKVSGKERDPLERAKAAFGYANVTGWMPMYSDPLMSAIGFDDLRFNQFGATSSPLQVPMVDIMGSLWGAPGAATKFLTGQKIDYEDRQSLRAIPFFRLAESAARVGSLGYIDPLAKETPADKIKRARAEQAADN